MFVYERRFAAGEEAEGLKLAARYSPGPNELPTCANRLRAPPPWKYALLFHNKFITSFAPEGKYTAACVMPVGFPPVNWFEKMLFRISSPELPVPFTANAAVKVEPVDPG